MNGIKCASLRKETIRLGSGTDVTSIAIRKQPAPLIARLVSALRAPSVLPKYFVCLLYIVNEG